MGKNISKHFANQGGICWTKQNTQIHHFWNIKDKIVIEHLPQNLWTDIIFLQQKSVSWKLRLEKGINMNTFDSLCEAKRTKIRNISFWVSLNKSHELGEEALRVSFSFSE